MYYLPRLRNGKLVPQSWPIAIYRTVNVVCWPLKEDAPDWAVVLDRCYFIIFLIVYIFQNYTAIRYLLENFTEIDKLHDGIMDYLIHTDLALRIIDLSANKLKMRKFLKEFYEDIYVERSSNLQLYQSLIIKLRPTMVYTYAYIVSSAFYIASPFVGLLQRNLGFPYIIPFDITPLSTYLSVAFAISWLNVIMISTLFGDANVMSEAMVHLHGQYLLLNDDLQLSSRELLQQGDSEAISHKFSEILKTIIERNVKLNRFAIELQKVFAYRIFFMFSFSAVVLCVLGYKTYTKIAVFFNIGWMLSKLQEMLTIGELGSTLIETTNQVSSMYYNSNWELIIHCSTNTAENVQLMKLIAIAIETNQKPFALTGLNFFSVSVTTGLKILKAAGSYFTCLLSIREK